MKVMRIYQRVAGTYTLQVHKDDGTTSDWRTGIPTKDEAIHRAEIVCRELGYRLDRRVRQSAARTNPTPQTKEVIDMGGIAKGATVTIVAANLKEKRREQLAPWIRKQGSVRRILNGRAFVEFKDGTKWWLSLDQVKLVADGETTDLPGDEPEVEPEPEAKPEEEPTEPEPAPEPPKAKGKKKGPVAV